MGLTLVVLFSLQGGIITELPAAVGMTAIRIFCNILLVFALTYLISRPIHLSYEDAAPMAIIAGSNGAGMTLLLVGPITSYGTILVLRKEFGSKTLLAYLGAVSVMALVFGYCFSMI